MQNIPILPGKRDPITVPELAVRCHEKPFRAIALSMLLFIGFTYQLSSGENYGFTLQKTPGLVLRQINTNPGVLLPLGPSSQLPGRRVGGLAQICLWSQQVGMICSSPKSLRSSCKEEVSQHSQC